MKRERRTAGAHAVAETTGFARTFERTFGDIVGRTRGRSLELGLGLAVALGTSSCASLSGGATNVVDVAQPYVRARAERDLACPPQSVSIERTLGNRYVARGCGRSASYDSACEDLQCAIAEVGVEPPAWRDRPEPLDAFR